MQLRLPSIAESAGLTKESQVWQGIKNIGQGIKNVWQGKPAVPQPVTPAQPVATPSKPAAPKTSLRQRYIQQIGSFASRMKEMQKTFDQFKKQKNAKVAILNQIGMQNIALQAWANNPNTSDQDLMNVASELNILIKSTQQLANFMNIQGQEDAKEAQVLAEMQRAATAIVQKAGLGDGGVPAQNKPDINNPASWGASSSTMNPGGEQENPNVSAGPIDQPAVKTNKPRHRITPKVEPPKKSTKSPFNIGASSEKVIKLSAYIGSPTDILYKI